MSSSKTMFCDLCVVLLFGLSSILAEDKPVTPVVDEGPKGNCSCGGFSNLTPDPESKPVLSQTPGLVVSCNSEGQATCKSLCNALATATKAKGPEILCNKLVNADELQLSAFYKACDNPWAYADMTADTALCCENNKVKTCASAAVTNTTEPAQQPEVKTVV
ncbi:uncharacterized protein LOC106136931 [Amyelois transitella]|uniref:uncharacterized protein LOC106136931 n=1 Tax=Amyelois transitella TaxID=680683 RepID=UPI00067A8A7C|nr:uncharacterized protein LOC106136931 [Amyelois transitella]